MEHRDPFLNLSPLDHRYWDANPVLFESLSQTLSERAAVRYMVRAEAALLRAHRSGHPEAGLPEVPADLEERVSPAQVAAEEEITRHNIRALVNVIQRYVPEKLKPWVHLGATSADILDTAWAMRVRDAVRGTVIPLVLNLLDELIRITGEHADTVQAGRTHGQLAVPVTFGFAMAEYVSRLGQSVCELERLSSSLRGKLSGAVGACNATSLTTADPQALEQDFLKRLGLQKAGYANQLVEPEHLLRLLLEMNVTFGIMANLADDLRHLQRSEIGEISETFGQGQVGSSTMPQKRNPWNSEHVKSLWKAFCPRVMTFYMDQISEHQRDLSNSASGRFAADYIAGFSAAAARMCQVVSSLNVNTAQMKKNLSLSGDGILAEPTYILLALSGHHDAHEIVRQVTLKSGSTGKTIHEILKHDYPDIWETLSARLSGVLNTDAETFYSNPSGYTGLAAQKARSLAKEYAQKSAEIRQKLSGSGGI